MNEYLIIPAKSNKILLVFLICSIFLHRSLYPGCPHVSGDPCGRVSNRAWIWQVLAAWEGCSFAPWEQARLDIIIIAHSSVSVSMMYVLLGHCVHCDSETIIYLNAIAIWLVEHLFENGPSTKDSPCFEKQGWKWTAQGHGVDWAFSCAWFRPGLNICLSRWWCGGTIP